VNEGVHWITAAHCVLDEEDSSKVMDVDFQLDGNPVYVEKVDKVKDLASLGGGPYASGFPISLLEGKVGDNLYILGFPLGWDNLLFTKGLIGAFDKKFSDGTSYTVYQLPVAPGDSGGPVFNMDGQVEGVLQISFCDGLFWKGFCPISGGSSLNDLKTFLGGIE